MIQFDDGKSESVSGKSERDPKIARKRWRFPAVGNLHLFPMVYSQSGDTTPARASLKGVMDILHTADSAALKQLSDLLSALVLPDCVLSTAH